MRKPFHFLFFAVFATLSLFADNFDELRIDQLYMPLALSGLLGFILFVFISFFVTSKRLAAIFSSIFSLIFFSYGHFIFLIKDIKFLGQVANRSFLLTSVLITVVAIFILKKIAKIDSSFKNTTIILNVISIFIIILPVSIISIKQIIRLSYPKSSTSQIIYSKNPQAKPLFPDIYYIIVDRYARRSTLEEIYNFDNSEFIQFLKDNGFYVARSRANYPFTTTSLASSLNMRYLDDLQEKMGKDSTDATPLYELIEDNEVIRYLKSKGYKYLHFGGEFGTTARNKNADFNYVYWGDPLNLSEFERKLLNQTIYTPLMSLVNRLTNNKLTQAESERQRSYHFALSQLNQVAKTTEIEGPKFVFVHIFISHDPFVFNRDGSYLSETEGNLKDYKQVYLDQLIFANEMIKQLINTLQTKSKTKPVIILQSDEGPYPENFKNNVDNFDWRKATKKELQEKFRITNNYFFPGVDADKLYLDITPINTFRLIFNLYFGEDLPLLQDKNYAQIDINHHFDVFEVTDLIR